MSAPRLEGRPPQAGPHTHAPRPRLGDMALVNIALLPAALWAVYLFGWPALNLLLVTLATALLAEAASLWLAGKPVRPHLSDGSALLTGLILALSLPPWAPWWIGVVGGLFAVVVGKQIFGGLGQNIFNPAMLGRTALLVSFPLEMTAWVTPRPLFTEHAPSFVEGLRITFVGLPDLDAVTSATLLDTAKTAVDQGGTIHGATGELFAGIHAFTGLTGGSMGETSALLLALGGLFLIWRGVIGWQVPAAVLGAVALLATVFHLIDPDRYLHAGHHLLSGALVLCAFFIATDPVTSPATRLGRILFGVGVGVLVWVIRTFGGYPDGNAFAILLMNALVPLIDHYVRPRIYGRDRRGAPLDTGKEGGR